MSSPLVAFISFLASVVLLVIASLWLRNVKRGRTTPKPEDAKMGLGGHAIGLAYFLFYALKRLAEGDNVSAMWLFVAALNGGLALGLMLAIERIASRKAREEWEGKR